MHKRYRFLFTLLSLRRFWTQTAIYFFYVYGRVQQLLSFIEVSRIYMISLLPLMKKKKTSSCFLLFKAAWDGFLKSNNILYYWLTKETFIVSLSFVLCDLPNTKWNTLEYMRISKGPGDRNHTKYISLKLLIRHSQ